MYLSRSQNSILTVAACTLTFLTAAVLTFFSLTDTVFAASYCFKDTNCQDELFFPVDANSSTTGYRNKGETSVYGGTFAWPKQSHKDGPGFCNANVCVSDFSPFMQLESIKLINDTTSFVTVSLLIKGSIADFKISDLDGYGAPANTTHCMLPGQTGVQKRHVSGELYRYTFDAEAKPSPVRPIPGTLTRETPYYCEVTGKNSLGIPGRLRFEIRSQYIAPPTISDFSVNGSSNQKVLVRYGTPYTVRWKTHGATSVKVENDQVGADGEMNYDAPAQSDVNLADHIVMITVSNSGGTTTRTISVEWTRKLWTEYSPEEKTKHCVTGDPELIKSVASSFGGGFVAGVGVTCIGSLGLGCITAVPALVIGVSSGVFSSYQAGAISFKNCMETGKGDYTLVIGYDSRINDLAPKPYQSSPTTESTTGTTNHGVIQEESTIGIPSITGQSNPVTQGGLPIGQSKPAPVVSLPIDSPYPIIQGPPGLELGPAGPPNTLGPHYELSPKPSSPPTASPKPSSPPPKPHGLIPITPAQTSSIDVSTHSEERGGGSWLDWLFKRK